MDDNNESHAQPVDRRQEEARGGRDQLSLDDQKILSILENKTNHNRNSRRTSTGK
jgi:hypothetical protein